MDLWIPTARRMGGGIGGYMNGQMGIRRATWHITWDRLDPRPSFQQVMQYLLNMHYEPHIGWNPENGDIVQFLPVDVAARALQHPLGTIATNTMGVLNVQIETYFSPGVNGWESFTDGPMHGADVLMGFLDQLGIPHSGPLVDGDYSRNPYRWGNESGHFGHMNVPNNTHTDPAAPPDMAWLFASTTPPAPTPPAPPIITQEDFTMAEFVLAVKAAYEIAGNTDRGGMWAWIKEIAKRSDYEGRSAVFDYMISLLATN